MPWKQGQSGNPKGRPKGSKQKLSERFLHNLHKDWKAHGAEAIEAVREASPIEYVKLVASLVPKEAHVVGPVTRQRADISMAETNAWIESVLGPEVLEPEKTEPEAGPKTHGTPVHLVPHLPEEAELKPSA